jgi:hypothetical protein
MNIIRYSRIIDNHTTAFAVGPRNPSISGLETPLKVGSNQTLR